MPKKVIHAAYFGESTPHTGDWRVWTHCWRNFRGDSSWAVSLADFKLLLDQEDSQELCDDCRDEVLPPAVVTPKVQPEQRMVGRSAGRPPSWADLRDLQRDVDQLWLMLSKLIAGLSDP